MDKCKECMEGTPHNYCCKLECGEHEFCRNCKYIPRHDCYYPDKTPIDWSKIHSLSPINSGI